MFRGGYRFSQLVIVSDIKMNRYESLNVSRVDQQGLSLIELLIALGLGVFIVAGIFQVTVGSRQAFEVVQAQSMTQESGRFATRFIADSARNAGYINYGPVDTGTGDAFAQSLIDTLEFTENLEGRWPAKGSFESGAVVVGGDSAGGAGFTDAKASGDYVSIRLQGDASFDSNVAGGFSMSDCEGKMISSDPDVSTIVNFFVKSNNVLACRVDTYSADLTEGAVQELVSGVEDMEIIYAVNGLDGVSFERASDMAGRWADVTSIRIALLGVSDNQPLNKQSDNTYTMLDIEHDDPDDGRMRQVFYQTIALRNR